MVGGNGVAAGGSVEERRHGTPQRRTPHKEGVPWELEIALGEQQEFVSGDSAAFEADDGLREGLRGGVADHGKGPDGRRAL